MVGKLVAVSLVVICLAGCGYRFKGDRDPVIAVQKLHIPPLDNTTTRVGIETLFTNEFIFEVNRHGYSEVVGRDAADAVLEGVIRDLRTRSIARRSVTVTLERRVTISVDLYLKDRQGNVLWQSSLSDREAYAVLADKTSTEGNLRRALAVIARRLAEKFHYRFTASF
ncbi:MAG: LPS assembly lipoprotein LptE [Desulfobacterales bacterium]